MSLLNSRKPIKHLVEVEDAIEMLIKELEKIGFIEKLVKTVDLYEAAWCKCAETVFARICVPHFPRSIVDGYAVRYQDLVSASEDNPVRLKLVGKVSVGEYYSKNIGVGECVEVDTGAGLPPNANAVVPVEYTESCGSDCVLVYTSVGFGENVAWPCSDAAQGDVVVVESDVLLPQKLAALAAQGISRVRVYKPKIAVIPTGIELVKPGSTAEPVPGKIYESASFLVKSLLERGCVNVVVGEIVPDDRKEIEEALERALKDNDIVFFIGGTSAGTEDLVYRVLESSGRLLVRGLRIKPGKPTLAAIVEDKLVIGLPGNPVSAYNVLLRFAIPLLEKLQVHFELSTSFLRHVDARLLVPAKPARGRHTFNPAYFIDKEMWVLPIEFESYMITRFSQTNSVVKLKAGVHGLYEVGREVPVEVYGESKQFIVASEMLSSKTLKAIVNTLNSIVKKNILFVEEGSSIALQLARKEIADIAIISGSMASGLDELSNRYESILVSQRIVVVERSAPVNACTIYPQSSVWGLISNKYCRGLEQVKVRTPRAAAWLFRKGYVSRTILPVEELVGVSSETGFRPTIVAEIDDKLTVLCKRDLDCKTIFREMLANFKSVTGAHIIPQRV